MFRLNIGILFPTGKCQFSLPPEHRQTTTFYFKISGISRTAQELKLCPIKPISLPT